MDGKTAVIQMLLFILCSYAFMVVVIGIVSCCTLWFDAWRKNEFQIWFRNHLDQARIHLDADQGRLRTVTMPLRGRTPSTNNVKSSSAEFATSGEGNDVRMKIEQVGHV